MSDSHPPDLHRVLGDFVEGKLAKRALLELQWNGLDITRMFTEALVARGYNPVTLAEIPVEPGERVPAFSLRNGLTYFGWVFWEKFTDRKMRKLFGSEVRNAKGDWEIQISSQSLEVVYANIRMKREMDIDAPGLW